MARLTISAKAAVDVAAIVEMLKDHAGINVANHYRRDIDALYDRLAMFPRSGMRRTSLGRYARIGIVPPYIIIYDLVDDEVMILRVLDGRRNITRRLVRE